MLNIRKCMARVLRISGLSKTTDNRPRTKLDVLCDQIIDSAIVGGITFCSCLSLLPPDASIKPALIAGALTFLIKLKEYRGIK